MKERILALHAISIRSVDEAAENGWQSAGSILVDSQSLVALRATVLIDDLAVGDDDHWHHRHAVSLGELVGGIAGNAVEVLVVCRTSNNRLRAKPSNQIVIRGANRACSSIFDQTALNLPVFAEIGGRIEEEPLAAGDADTGVVELRAAVRALHVRSIEASSGEESVI